MPAQKRQLETATPPPSPPPPPPLQEVKPDDSPQVSENHNQEQLDNTSDSDESQYSSDGEKDEFVFVKLTELRKEVQCPICLGIIRKTRTVMECLHRFCRACIDKSMRLGNNECPACRTHCASRRSLRDDPNYDALIAALYPDIDKYEEEELAFHEEEKARNKQIQDSIAETFRRQAEALANKRASGKAAAGGSLRRQSNYRNLRGRRNHRVIEHHESDEDDGANNGSKEDSSSADEEPEVKLKRYKRWGGTRNSQKANDDSESNRESHQGREILGWGRGGTRSKTRHGVLSWPGGRLSRNNRISKIIDHLRFSNEDDVALKVSLTLISVQEGKIPSLKRPYLCCSPTSSVRHLCQYVAMQTSVEASEIEMLMIKDFHPVNNSLIFKSGALSLGQYELLLLDEHQTLKEIHDRFTQQNLVLAYQLKAQG